MAKDPYAWCARLYDNFLESTTNKVKLVANDLFVAEPGMNILDIGCGTGSLLKLYQDARCKVTGIDSSPSMLNICKSKLDGLGEIHLGNASNLPFSDESFDLVLSVITIHEMPPAVRSSVMKGAKRCQRSFRNEPFWVVRIEPRPYIYCPPFICSFILLPFSRPRIGNPHRSYSNFQLFDFPAFTSVSYSLMRSFMASAAPSGRAIGSWVVIIRFASP